MKTFYTWDEILELLEKAEAQGYNLEAGSYLESLTVHQLDTLVNHGPE